jgi:predicted transcriptional regulator
MAHLKLTAQKVRNIKKHILTGELTHEEIAKKYGVSRPLITKIHLGMIDPTHKNARWGHIVVQPEENLEEIFKVSDFK